MGNAFGRDGVVTKIVEGIPGGGFITGPVHAIAGNPIHAAQAAVAGFGTLTGAVVGGPVAGLAVGAGTTGLQSIFTELGFEDQKKDAAVASLSSGHSEEAAKIVLEAVQQKVRENVHRLSAESGGRRCLRSCHGTYLRAYDCELKVDLATGNPKAWENWYIEDWKENVALKAIHSPGRFLSAHEGSEDVSLALHRPQAWEMWKPFENDNGSWSFLSVHGAWLSADVNGRVYTVEKCREWEQFWLEWW